MKIGAPSLLLVPLLFLALSVAEGKKSKKGKSKSEKCPSSPQEAAAIASSVMAGLWKDMVEAGCDGGAIADYLTDDMYVVVESETGLPATFSLCGLPEDGKCQGVEFGGDCDTPCLDVFSAGFAVQCMNGALASFTAHNAVIDADDCTKFVVHMNEYIQIPAGGELFPIATGRTYDFVMNQKKKGPEARMKSALFHCPWNLDSSLVQCPGGFIRDVQYEL